MVFAEYGKSWNVSSCMTFIVLFLILGCTGNGETQDQNPGLPRMVISSTSFDKSSLLITDTISVSKPVESASTITVNEQEKFQIMDGFGYSLTGGSALHLFKMSTSARKELLTQLFDCERGNCVSYLRISIGASDLDEKVFSYNDLPFGHTDFNLEKFDISQDQKYLIPILKEIIDIQNGIKIMASPWSAPGWMKTNGSSVGGSLKPECFDVYSRYFLKYIEAMRNEGIAIDAITIQNEPQHGGNNPSMIMSAQDQAKFIKENLGPLFFSNNITTKIVIWDHNCDQYNYPLTILRDPEARQYTDGSAFHLYAGDISALGIVHDEFPEKNIYFTEQWTGANSNFSADLIWHSRHLLIGASRNWAKIILEWNLATDPSYGPFTPGGCSLCKGAVTIDQNKYTTNVSYYIIAHLSKFVLPGSRRIFSTYFESSPNVAFVRPDGKKVLFIMNESSGIKTINIKSASETFSVRLKPSTVNTISW